MSQKITFLAILFVLLSAAEGCSCHKINGSLECFDSSGNPVTHADPFAPEEEWGPVLIPRY